MNLRSNLKSLWRSRPRAAGSTAGQRLEVDQPVASLEQWRQWSAENRQLLNRDNIKAAAKRVLVNGVREPLTEFDIPGREFRPTENLREGLGYKGVSSRGRGVLLVIERLFANKTPYEVRAYAAEALTGFARRMHFVFPYFIGSEYGPTKEEAAGLFPIRSEDLGALSFADGMFDLVSTNEVLEHVPDMDQCLRELARVLKPGGWHIGTVPFRFNSEDSVVKATLVDNGVQHLTEPEYHGNPMSAEGSLVFEIPGWDILGRCEAAGFAEAHMRFIASERHGCLSSDAGGIFVLCARR